MPQPAQSFADRLRDALPQLASPGHEVIRAAALTALLDKSGENWQQHAALNELLRWVTITAQQETEEGGPTATSAAWAASLLLPDMVKIIFLELERTIDQVLGNEPDRRADNHHSGDRESAISYPGSEITGDPATARTPESEPGSHRAATDPNQVDADTAARLEAVREALGTIQQEISEQIARRRSLLQGRGTFRCSFGDIAVQPPRACRALAGLRPTHGHIVQF